MTEKQFENAEYLDKAPNDTHKGLSKYIAETTGKKVSPPVAALVLRLYSQYLKSPAVAEAREAEKAQREKEREAKKAAALEAKKKKLAKIEADRRKLLEELGLDADEGPEDADVIDFPTKGQDEADEPPFEETEEPEKVEDEEPEISVDESDDEFVVPDDDEDWETEDEEDF